MEISYIHLRDEVGLTAPEIAFLLGLHVNTIYSRYRKEKGICACCDLPVAPGNLIHCSLHWKINNEKSAQRMSRQAQERKNGGLCIRCGKFAEPGKSLCAEHAEDNRRRARKVREERAALGLCRQCFHPVVEGSVMCRKHLDIKSAYEKQKRQK